MQSKNAIAIVYTMAGVRGMYKLLRAKQVFWYVQCTDFLYQAVRRAVNVLNVSTCI